MAGQRAQQENIGAETSGSDGDGFDEDMEALRRACVLTGRSHPNELVASSDSDSDADLDLVRSIQERFSMPVFMKPLSSLPPVTSEEDEDDFETLRAIERRFSAYKNNTLENSRENYVQNPQQVGDTSIASEKEISNNLSVNKTNTSKGFPDSEDFYTATQNIEPLVDVSASSQTAIPELSAKFPVTCGSFPKSAQVFVDAIKKNRSCQKFIRSKLIQIEARIEENKKLKDRVKILKDFQVSCQRRTNRALSQKKDPRVQLISVPKLRSPKIPKKMLCYGPEENSHVANYRLALTKFPRSINREKWSEAERGNLQRGIKQQFQEMLLQKSVTFFSDLEGSSGDSSNLDIIMASISDVEITHEKLRLFLPKVNWEQLASMYLMGRRSGAECETRWLNWEDPLINHNSWDNMEDKNLLLIIQQRGLNNWIETTALLGTNRTPFQCLARYQRSLNACIMKREWTKEEDAQLSKAVEAYGEGNWQWIASSLEGRTGTQCSNRWKKTLHPSRQRVGRWTSDEDKRLNVAVMLFGPKTWKKIAQFVPGRTQVQCRERWVNSLDPSLKRDQWTKEEDSKLKAAIEKYGYSWSKVASCLSPRTDNQCWRRWKRLFPKDVPLLSAARKIQKSALISNFVDRESERPALGPSDFLSLHMNSSSESDHIDTDRRKREARFSNKPEKSGKENDRAFCYFPKKARSRRCRRQAQICLDVNENDAISKTERVKKLQSKNRSFTELKTDQSKSLPGSTLLLITNGEDRLGSMLPSESLELTTANSDLVVSPPDVDDITSKNKRKVAKLNPIRRKQTEPLEPQPSILLTPNNLDGSKKKKKVRKPCLRKTNLADSEDTLLPPESWGSSVVNEDATDSFKRDTNTPNKKRRVLESTNDRASLKHISELRDEYDDTLASFLRSKTKEK